MKGEMFGLGGGMRSTDFHSSFLLSVSEESTGGTKWNRAWDEHEAVIAAAQAWQSKCLWMSPVTDFRRSLTVKDLTLNVRDLIEVHVDVFTYTLPCFPLIASFKESVSLSELWRAAWRHLLDKQRLPLYTWHSEYVMHGIHGGAHTSI